MKNVKRFLSFIVASVLVLAMSMTALAVTNFTIKGAVGKRFGAYQLLTEKGKNNSGDIVYGVNPKYEDALKTATGKTTELEILAYLDELKKANDPAAVRTFADTLFAALDTSAPDAESTDGVFTNLKEGYYMLLELESEGTTEADGLITVDEFGLAILTPVNENNKEIEAKEDGVTHTKEVYETNDSDHTGDGWGDVADYDIGDDVPFRLTGKTSKNMESYTEGYFFQFEDEMADSLDFNGDVRVFLNSDAGINEKGEGESDAEILSGFKVEANGDHRFTVTFDNLQGVTDKAGNPVEGGDTIIVRFSANLNKNAKIGMPGQINKSRIVYNNNPYTKDQGKTPWEIVIVFTFEVDVNKVEEINGNKVPRDKAVFELFKILADGSEVSLGQQGGDTTTKFVWKGIDAGKYILKEITPPPGYNPIDPIEFTVEAQYDNSVDPPELIDLIVKDKNGTVMGEDGFTAHYAQDGSYTGDGIIEADIINSSGIELPSTGGMGTTIFYVVGALLAIGAGVVLVTRRRVQK